MMNTIGQLPAEAAHKFGNNTALTFEGRDFNYVELNDLIERAASGLAELGVNAGDVVTIYATNSWQYIVSYYATYRLGAVLNPVNAMLLPKDVEYFVKDCGATTIIASASTVANVVGLKDRTQVTNVIAIGEVVPDGALPFDTLTDHKLPAVPPAQNTPEDLAAICYTSGTTGTPKGVMQSHRAVVMNADVLAKAHGRDADDCGVMALPLAHVYGTVLINIMMMHGMKLIVHAGFNPSAFLADIAKYRATIVDGVPPMYLAMLNHPDLSTTDLSSLNYGIVAGSSMPVPSIKAIETGFDISLCELWGMTELAGAGTTSAKVHSAIHGSIGTAITSCEARIVDTEDATRILPAGERGELMFRGPVVMMGYYNNAAATSETLHPDGWMHTGDIATMDVDGNIYMVDRKKDMLIVGASNVYPAEVEAALAAHPDVAQCAVGHLPDPILGQVPKAYVMAKSGATATQEDLIAFCKVHLAEFKCPRAVQFVDELPKNATGKVLRRMLSDLDPQAEKVA